MTDLVRSSEVAGDEDPHWTLITLAVEEACEHRHETTSGTPSWWHPDAPDTRPLVREANRALRSSTGSDASASPSLFAIGAGIATSWRRRTRALPPCTQALSTDTSTTSDGGV